MPIKIPDKLPATAQLRKENIFVMSEKKAMHQDIRPLKIVIVNLMPTNKNTNFFIIIVFLIGFTVII